MKQLIMIIILDTNHKATDEKKKKRYSQLPGGLSCLGDPLPVGQPSPRGSDDRSSAGQGCIQTADGTKHLSAGGN